MPLLKRFVLVLLLSGCGAGENDVDNAVCGPGGLCPTGFGCGNDNRCHKGIGNVDASQQDAAIDAPAPCGNGQLDTGEVCDPAIPANQQGACPTSCDDGNPCTADSISGSAAACTAHCVHTAITTCASGDGCCPSGQGCNHNTDNDCSASCGNGAVETGETCDKAIVTGPGACPTLAGCNDSDPCTADSIVGSVDNCTAQCLHTTISTCGPREGCCPSGCNANTDPDCSPVCGNSVLEAGETCDPPSSCPQDVTACNDNNVCTVDTSSGSAPACTAACQHTPVMICRNGDGCCPPGCNANTDSDCQPTCGNGVIESGETCDPPSSCPQNVASCNDNNSCTLDSFSGSASNCTAQCAHGAITQCNINVNDGCCPASCNTTNDRDCSAVCGNGVLEGGEQCDTGIPSGPGKCPTPADCNDNNPCTSDSVQGIGCQAHCLHTPVVSCSLAPDGCCPAGCNAVNDRDCSPVCGNGVVEPGEFCDTAIGSTLAGHCPQPSECDDGNPCTIDQLVGANCQAHCTNTPETLCQGGDACCPAGCNSISDFDCPVVCGNGVVEPPDETCDTVIPNGQPGSCPTDCPPVFGMCIDNTLVSAGTCQAQCVSTGGDTTCSASANMCCPYGCSSANDADCQSTWTSMTLGSGLAPSCPSPVNGDLFSCPCTFFNVTLLAGHSYVVTTCAPVAPYAPGASDTTVEVKDPFGTQVAFNDDCHAPSLPALAGWSCTNGNGSEFGSCAAADTGGFIAPATGTYGICLRAYPFQGVGSTTNVTLTLWSN